jgi:hypothetical protein
MATWVAVGRFEPYAPILDFLGDTFSPVWATIAKPFTARQPVATLPTVATGGCVHPAPEPVRTVGGDLVAWLCPDCDQELPADWR